MWTNTRKRAPVYTARVLASSGKTIMDDTNNVSYSSNGLEFEVKTSKWNEEGWECDKMEVKHLPKTTHILSLGI